MLTFLSAKPRVRSVLKTVQAVLGSSLGTPFIKAASFRDLIFAFSAFAALAVFCLSVNVFFFGLTILAFFFGFGLDLALVAGLRLALVFVLIFGVGSDPSPGILLGAFVVVAGFLAALVALVVGDFLDDAVSLPV